MNFLSLLRSHRRPHSFRLKEKRRPTAWTRLELEILEDRALLNNGSVIPLPVAAADVNTASIVGPGNPAGNSFYVQNLYTKFLGRVAVVTNPSDAGYWVNLLNNGTPVTTVANGVVRSPEALDLQVNQIYQHYLNRNADSVGESFYVNLLRQGATLEQVTTTIILSPEYQTKYVSTMDFVQSLYNNILNRNGSTEELVSWVKAINANGRSAVVQSFLNSAEYRTDKIEQFYSQLLNRATAPSQGEVSFWVDSGLDILSIEVAFAASNEFQANG